MKYFLYSEDLNVDELLYKPDLAVSEKYQAFSSELLRISLIGIAAIGFFYEKLNTQLLFEKQLLFSITVKEMLHLSLSLLAISSAFALSHRYFSSDCIAYMISTLRYTNAANNESSDTERKNHFLNNSKKERKKRNRLLKLCKFLLAISGIAMALGAIGLVISFSFGIK